MKLLVDNMPCEPKECLFSSRTYQGNYVCKLKGNCIQCIVENCNYLLAKENEHESK